MDDNLIKPIDGQNVFSIKSAKDKNLNDKKKRQDSREQQGNENDDTLGEVVLPDEEKPHDDKSKNGLDFCA
jgi:hypothetical protein